MVGGEVRSDGVRLFRRIDLVRRWGGHSYICFRIPAKTKGGRTLSVVAHSVSYGGGGEKGKLVQIVNMCNDHRG